VRATGDCARQRTAPSATAPSAARYQRTALFLRPTQARELVRRDDLALLRRRTRSSCD
jgi:hypothetical protein